MKRMKDGMKEMRQWLDEVMCEGEEEDEEEEDGGYELDDTAAELHHRRRQCHNSDDDRRTKRSSSKKALKVAKKLKAISGYSNYSNEKAKEQVFYFYNALLVGSLLPKGLARTEVTSIFIDYIERFNLQLHLNKLLPLLSDKFVEWLNPIKFKRILQKTWSKEKRNSLRTQLLR